jgi:hypothetical protein
VLLGVSATLAVVMTIAAIAAWRHLGPAAAAYARALADAGLDRSGGEPAQVRSTLAYNVAVTAGTALVATLLALVIRKPLRWAQVSTWCTVVVVWMALGCGLASGPNPAGSVPGRTSSELDRLSYDLVPQWYSPANAVLGLFVLASVTAVGVLLLRSSVQDYYRPASSQQDPRWTAFVQKQADGTADGTQPAPDPSH